MDLSSFVLLILFRCVLTNPVPIANDEYPMENPELFEGDILQDDGRYDRNAVVEEDRRWPKGRIPYIIDISLRSKEDHIKSAMQHIQDNTCITFEPKTDDDRQYVKIFAGRGCYSKVGKTTGEQALSLGPGCHNFGTTLHELVHAIGFYHEHSRSDRDEYLNIHYENIKEDGYPMENPDLFEGDILLDDGRYDRNAVVEAYRRWPKGRIPYIIDITLRSKEDHIKSAMKHIQDNTCITFEPKMDDDRQYVKIFAGRGCYSKVGKTIGEQPLSLGPGCHSFGSTLHELVHAIGFYHEHSRSDRDKYLNIHYENIREGYEDQFIKLRPKQNVLYDNLDYNSIMLYGETVFTKDHYLGLKTMTSKKGIPIKDVEDKTGLSDSDIFRIKKMYNCDAE